MTLDRFKTLQEAEAEQTTSGGIILVNDDMSYSVCQWCCGDCKCRSTEWIESLEPSWSEAAPENMARDQRFNQQKELFA